MSDERFEKMLAHCQAIDERASYLNIWFHGFVCARPELGGVPLPMTDQLVKEIRDLKADIELVKGLNELADSFTTEPPEE